MSTRPLPSTINVSLGLACAALAKRTQITKKSNLSISTSRRKRGALHPAGFSSAERLGKRRKLGRGVVLHLVAVFGRVPARPDHRVDGAAFQGLAHLLDVAVVRVHAMQGNEAHEAGQRAIPRGLHRGLAQIPADPDRPALIPTLLDLLGVGVQWLEPLIPEVDKLLRIAVP